MKTKQELKRGDFQPYYLIEKLKLAEVNRDLNNQHAENFKNKLKENDWLMPIVISKNGDVIEGHHRIQSAKLLKQKTIPAYIIDWVDTNIAKEHLNVIIGLNNGNRAWNTLDYLKAFARENKEYKIVYNSYLKNHNNISVGNIVNCYFGNRHTSFKLGTAKIINKDFSDYLISKFSYLNKEYSKNKIAAYCVREMIYIAFVKANMNIKTMDYLFKKYEDMAKSDHPSITSINKFRPIMELYLNEYNMILNQKNK